MRATDRAADLICNNYAGCRGECVHAAEALAAADPPLLITPEILTEAFEAGHDSAIGAPGAFASSAAYLASRGPT